ncbi:MAG: NAD(P)-dependent alcohol dehydrogenase [Alphaproteobacteria bacterium]|uniref:zinc-dependent alcohol dehydrogenase family protein n=1 Tax=Hyphomonas sp. TaxID=87 RepID=UPI001D75AC7B|nr:NAD(P)-dependent alcohol dehydrogenase [Alphaproteobacteria bacterium]MBU2084810.1 NAD(P)-dependent alcohol dehydrogenase [Alphaproteobacteria bacterium]MBU2144112.1 NAD(P)-dependent alcohol dehydrogenase [Alphaproteobacteria bacterium]MBU2198227.1 NAD(P)-dependent alcohol dehydrogenase [Alphaproteobacteria bacterium]
MKVAAVKKPGGPGNLVIEERADPTPGRGEILVRVKASSLNYHDFVVVMGGIPTPDGRIPMSDGAGEVVAVGEGTKKFKVGDKVLSLFFPNWNAGAPQMAGFASVPGDGADGFGAEMVAAPESAFTRMPEGYSFEEAATLPCAALTAWRALMVEAKIKPGDWVLTQGTGGVSIFALQFAKAAGARVIATSSSDEKLKRLKELGADHLINYKDTPEWGKKAKELTGGRGVDEVVEIGGPGTLAQSIAASKMGGHISLIGVLTGVSGEVPTAALFSMNITMSGITVGSASMQEDMIAAIEANGIKPVLDQTFPLDKIAEAFGHQASQKHFGKIIVSI